MLIAGFHIQGPTKDIGQGGDVREAAIRIWPFPSLEPIRNIEISNMEIYHWSGSAISVDDIQEASKRGRFFTFNPDAVRIRNNYLHHNRHGSGFGYGVSIGDGAFALIERNVFDENRHAIAASSADEQKRDYSGYIVRDNLILGGGGEHCPEFILFPCWDTHQIDMHGDGNLWYSSTNWQCGTAGETILIYRNTILYDEGPAIKIRGNPKVQAIVDSNVFRHKSKGDAIKQNGSCRAVQSSDHFNNPTFAWDISNPIDIRPSNRFDVNPFAAVMRCNFIGDAQQDSFVATGVTWWAHSPVTQQWRYMNTMTEGMSQLQLGDVDGDGQCDVALKPATGQPIRQYSKGGTSDWRPAPN